MGCILSKHPQAISTVDTRPTPPQQAPSTATPALPPSPKIEAIPLKNLPGSLTQAALLKSAQLSSLARSGPGKKLTVLKKLDEGTEGNVFLVRDETGAFFAAKSFKKESKEADLFKELGNNSSGWPKTYGLRPVYLENDAEPVQALISEYIDGVNLESYSALLHASSLPDSQKEAIVRHIAIQLRDALQYSGSKNIEHRDIKLWNIHVERNSGRVVLLDLGVGTKHDSPPESTGQERPTAGIYPGDAKALGNVVTALLPANEPENSMQTLSSQLFGLSMTPAAHAMPLASSFARPHANVLSKEFLDKSTLNEIKAKENLLQLIKQ